METSYKTKGLRNVCEIKSVALNVFGEDLSSALHARLADIYAAKNIKDIIVGAPIKVKHGDDYIYQIRFGRGLFILLEANHVQNPLDSSGYVDWDRINRIKIISVGGNDYDD